MAAQLALLLLGSSLSCAGVTGVEAKWVSKSGHPTTSTISPAHSYSTFSYASMTSNRYATPLKSPISFPTPFAPPLSEVSSLLGSNIVYTTYSLNPEATTIEDGPYGQSVSYFPLLILAQFQMLLIVMVLLNIILTPPIKYSQLSA